MTDLFSPVDVGPYRLKNRIVMAPMTRARCADGNSPTELVAEYYAQRATAGLLISESTSVSPLSVTRDNSSALYRDSQIVGWKRVVEAVHAKDGLIFQQLYHVGRKSDPTRMPDGLAPVAPSAIAARGQIKGKSGAMIDFALPRALETHEVSAIVEDFHRAAERSLAAGLDGVEIHGANSYLIDQFLRDGTNQRTDRYGGSVQNRVRFCLEIVDAVTDVWGTDRVGLRVSPHASGDGISDSDPVALYGHLAREMNRRRLAYFHLVESEGPGFARSPASGTPEIMPVVRRAFAGPLIVNGDYDRARADKVIAQKRADLVSFANLYIPNPDLVARLERGGPFNVHDTATTYGGDAKGYTDYPCLS